VRAAMARHEGWATSPIARVAPGGPAGRRRQRTSPA